MTEFVFGVIGAVVGIGGLALTFVGLRHQTRQARELDARESSLRAKEREAEHREASLHASMLRVEVSKHLSSLDPSVTLWRLTATNGSTQPFTSVTLRYGDQVLTTPSLNGHMNPGASVAEALPTADGEPVPARCVVEFTDVAGRLWRRRATGDLRRGRPGPDGEVTWDAGAGAFVHVAQFGEPPGAAAPMRASRSGVSCGVTALILVVASLVTWYLTTR